MIDCIYLGNYDHTILQDPIKSGPQDFSGFLLLHAKVYVLSDKFGLEDLRTTAMNSIIEALGKNPDCVLHESFKDTIDVVYKQTMPEAADIRGCLVEALATHETLLDTEEFKSKVQEHTLLACDLLMSIREKSRHKKTVFLHCSECEHSLSVEIVAENLHDPFRTNYFGYRDRSHTYCVSK